MHEIGLRARAGAHHLFRDQSLAILTREGDASGEGPAGFYYANTRLLSRFALRVNGRAPDAVQVHPARDDLLVAYYQDPRLTDDEILQDRALLVQLTVTVGAGFHLDLDVRNHSLAPVSGELSLVLDADFADLEEVRRGPDAAKVVPEATAVGGRRMQEAPVRRTCDVEDTGELRFDYLHPDLRERVSLRFSPSPRCREDGVGWALALAPQASWHACIEVAATHEGVAVSPTARCYGAFAPEAAGPPAWARRATRVGTPNDSVRRSWERAVADLGALALRAGPPAEQAAFAAGIPIYHNPFGRDLLTTSWQALLATPELLESAILICARTQGTTTDDFRDEQPGRIIQQLRTGPLNLLNLNPRGRYYSDYAAPADFLIMLGQHFMWTGDREFLRAHLPAARRTLDWFERAADLDGDGFYEYQTRSRQGDRHQGWKDSRRAILHADGSDPPLPIATCEVQGYVYAAKQQFGAALLALGQVRHAWRLLREAADLKRRFNRAYWMPDEGFLAMALDGEKRPVRSIGSNAGHCLATGIVAAEHAPAVAGRLLAPDLFSGWGVRTLSCDHTAYNPFSYHLGSVWTVEQGTIAFGLKRYGFGQLANDVAKGTFDLAERYQLHRLPEAVGGHARDQAHPFPGLYPQACWPQAWSAGAVILLVQAMLGLRPIAPLGLLLVYPELPEWLPELTLRGLRVGDSRLTIQCRRQRDGTTDYRVLERHGRVRVLREPPESSVRHGVLQRVTDPLVSALKF
jgi:glycogen debranching enzyme